MIKSAAQVEALKKKPVPEQTIQQTVESIAGIAKSSIESSDKVVTELRAMAENFGREPVNVKIEPAAQIKHWKFSFEYDKDDRLISMSAESK
jgi:hypothetical protein